MSPTPSALRAIEWLERQLADLGGIRNATSRDPIFKNWRQATLTALQRTWPGDQARFERFLRIPFSPADARVDARAQREWYGRGCQEAARVLKGCIADIHAHGVPDIPDEIVMGTGGSSGEFEVDFPTVDLPTGDLGSAAPLSRETQNPFAEFVDSAPQASDARIPAPPLRQRVPEAPALAPPTAPATHAKPRDPAAASEASAPETANAPKPGKKGLNMRARLLDLLGFAQLSAKTGPNPPRETPSSANLPSLDLPAAKPTAPVRDLDIVPLGGAVARTPAPSPIEPVGPEPSEAARPSGSWPLMRALDLGPDARPASPGEPAASPDDATIGATGDELANTPVESAEPVVVETASSAPEPALPPVASEPEPDVPPHEPGMSVVMTRPTTLRGAIEKVSIESLLSDQFRSAGPAATPPSPAAPLAPVASAPSETQPATVTGDASGGAEDFEPGAPVEELLSAASGAHERPVAPATEEDVESPPAPRSKILPLPKRRAARPEREPADDGTDSAVGRVDPEAFARATEDFMRSSPVLGATGSRVKRGRDAERGREAGREAERGRDETAYQDADAIAIFSMLDDLDEMGVPAGRRNETRARLKDLAGRIEKGELEWPVLKKAVYFAMEYPELARRLVPVLLPWFDRAA